MSEQLSRPTLTHTLVPMAGRDPHEHGRASTPLELLFDLTFVIAFGAASDELSHQLAEGHIGLTVLAFCFATFAVSWAWINFTWFASAYDTDDWVFRLTTMVQMVGVLILALGIPAMFTSVIERGNVDNKVMVLGYVVMRVPMVVQWLRAARQDPTRADICRLMAGSLVVAQIGWIALAFAPLTLVPVFLIVAALLLVELSGPLLAERRRGGTPWHAHHIAERYGLMVIITLGEGLLGTTAALSALVAHGWSVDVALLGLAGVALPFGIWWSYFTLPSGALLHRFRSRAFGWGYGHIPLFGAIVAVGSGLHGAAYLLDGGSTLGPVAVVLAVAIPLAAYVGLLFALYSQVTHTLSRFHGLVLAGSAVLICLPIALAAAGVDLVVCLLVLAAAPWMPVLGYETVGHRHEEAVLAALD